MGQLLRTPQDVQNKQLISIIVPVYNESEVIEIFHSTLSSVLKIQQYRYEIVYIDDGSKDNSYAILNNIKANDANVILIKLSRNFGKELAMSAGLQKVRGDAAIVMDCDLQDPPNNIPLMVDAWLSGVDIVNMRRIDRKGDSLLKKQTAKYFYQLIRMLSDVEIEENVGDFRLLSRKAINAINQLPERNRFMKGLFAWVGFQKITIDYVRMPRQAGQTKWPYWKLWNLALDGITSFSTAPLKISTYIGFLFAAGSFIVALVYLFKTLMFGDAVRGFPTLFLTMLFLGGIQLMSIGVIGEYLSRLFTEIKGRPLFIVDECLSKTHEDSEPTRALAANNDCPSQFKGYN